MQLLQNTTFRDSIINLLVANSFDCLFFVASVGMQPDLILNEDQRKERFSVSLSRKKIKTEHVALPTSKPIANVSPLITSSIPRTSIVPEGSQTTDENSKQELLMTIKHKDVKNYEASVIPKRVSVIVRRPPTNKSVTVKYNEKNDVKDARTDYNDEQQTKSGTAEPSIEYGPNFDISEEHQMLDMISPQNHGPIPPDTSISDTMDIFLKDTNNEYIHMNFAELPEEEERPLTSNIQQENLEKEDTKGDYETSNGIFKQYSTCQCVTNGDSEEMQMILKYVHKKFGRMERRKKEYSELSFDSSFLLKENLSTEKR